MPDKRTHRGPHPADIKLFAAAVIPGIRAAVEDFSLLLTKGYAEKSALKLVGDRFSLTQRQRLAVMRCACSDGQLARRKQHRVGVRDIRSRQIAIDGYNLLITIEAAISNAFVFVGRDGAFKDLAGIHGTYRRVSETAPAIQLIGQFLRQADIAGCLWLLDSPVSNSGRLKKFIEQIAQENRWQWQVRLLTNPDTELIKTDLTVASSDSVVLNGCRAWVDLAGEIIRQKLPAARIVDLSGHD